MRNIVARATSTDSDGGGGLSSGAAGINDSTQQVSNESRAIVKGRTARKGAGTRVVVGLLRTISDPLKHTT